MTANPLLHAISSQLPGDSRLSDALILLLEITGKDRAWWLAHPEDQLTALEEKKLETAIKQLQDGIPLPYVIGHWGFLGLDFIVTPDVLIPRPETELLVETALEHIHSIPGREIHILDVGTGSGIIAISLALNSPGASFSATDISPLALKIARLNAERNHVSDRINFFEADIVPVAFGKIHFDIICANLPYIPRETLENLEVFGKEPTLALDGGKDGLDLIRKLLVFLSRSEIGGTLILLEIEERQAKQVENLVNTYLPGASTRIKRDLAGHDRLAMIRIG